MDRKLRDQLIKAALEVDSDHALRPDKLIAKIIEQRPELWEKVGLAIARQASEAMLRSWLNGLAAKTERNLVLPFISSLPFKDAEEFPKTLVLFVEGKIQSVPMHRASVGQLDQRIQALDAQIKGKTPAADRAKKERARLKRLRRTILPQTKGHGTMLIADALAKRSLEMENKKMASRRKEEKRRRVRIRSAKGAHA